MESNPNVITGILDIAEVKTFNYWREVFVEFLGTFLLCFFGCASVSGQTHGFAEKGVAPDDFLLISLTFGMMVALCAFMFGEISGCHINPAVTISMLIGRRIKLIRVVGYVLAQLLGGILGVGFLYIIQNNEEDKTAQAGQLSIGVVISGLKNDSSGDQKDSGIIQLRGMFAELAGTFLLVLVILSCTDKSRPSMGGYGGVPFAIGMAVATSHFALIRFTGSGINPARSFGSFVIHGVNYSGHWIYWVGPVLGGALAVVIYDLMMCPFYKAKPEAVQVLGNVAREAQYKADA